MAAIDRELLMTLTEALAALVQRVGAVEGIARIPGPQGEPGQPGADGAPGRDADPITDEQIKAAAAEWLAANITQPADGRDGVDGQDGRDADPITAEQIQLAVDLWFEINRDSIRGADGRDGRDGRDGADGAKGDKGERGLAGRDGRDGKDGIGIELVEQTDEETFRIVYGDGREVEIKLPVTKRTSVIGTGGGGIVEIRAGAGIRIDDTDPRRPIIRAAGGGGGGDPIATTPGFYATAFEPITAGQVIVIRTDEKAALASADNITHAGRICAIATTSAGVGDIVGFARVGEQFGTFGFIAGRAVYLGLNGGMTQSQSVGLFQQELGVALASDRVIFQPGLCIVR